MRFELAQGSFSEILSDTLITYVYADVTSLTGQTAAIDHVVKNQISSLLVEQPSLGKLGEVTILHTLGFLPAKQVALVGLGKQAELSADKLRSVMGTVMRLLQHKKAKSVVLPLEDLPGNLTDNVTALVEGSLLGTYRFDEYKTAKKKDDDSQIERVVFTAPSGVKADSLLFVIEQATMVSESVIFARNLVNHPANVMTPSAMAARAEESSRSYGFEATVLDKPEIEKLGMQAFLSVARGSQEPPRLIILKYMGNPADNNKIAFVGKGITFDSGGISLKPSEGMDEMKTDMAGGAAVLGAFQAIARLKLKINVLGVIPCTENMPSGIALKPGDIISSMAGKTIEILNTDAEGRLLLADAVTYARQAGASKIVDLATLTGACVVALGSHASGIISNHDEWCDQVLAAAKASGEKMWRLPAFDEYKEQIKSAIADLKNTGGRPAGTITAGLFIAAFAEDTPWVHIDIAGTATVNKDTGSQVKGATGVGVRTLVQLARALSDHEG